MNYHQQPSLRVRSRTWLAAAVALLALTLTGCETTYVANAARSSLASFVTNVFSTAVNDTIGP